MAITYSLLSLKMYIQNLDEKKVFDDIIENELNYAKDFFFDLKNLLENK